GGAGGVAEALGRCREPADPSPGQDDTGEAVRREIVPPATIGPAPFFFQESWPLFRLRGALSYVKPIRGFLNRPGGRWGFVAKQIPHRPCLSPGVQSARRERAPLYRRPQKERPMQLFSWLHKRMTGRPQTRSTPARRPAPRFRLQLETLEGRDVPSTLTVTNNLDSGAGSLRAEIAAARSKDTIVFAPSVDGATITLSSGQLEISKNVTIQGPGAGLLTVSGDLHSRVFQVDNKVTVTLSGMTISNGHAGFVGTVYNNDGGGILNLGTLTISSCILSGNSA